MFWCFHPEKKLLGPFVDSEGHGYKRCGACAKVLFTPEWDGPRVGQARPMLVSVECEEQTGIDREQQLADEIAALERLMR